MSRPFSKWDQVQVLLILPFLFGWMEGCRSCFETLVPWPVARGYGECIPSPISQKTHFNTTKWRLQEGRVRSKRSNFVYLVTLLQKPQMVYEKKKEKKKHWLWACLAQPCTWVLDGYYRIRAGAKFFIVWMEHHHLLTFQINVMSNLGSVVWDTGLCSMRWL